MKKTLIFLALVPLFLSAQTADSVSIGPGYMNEVWYDLETGTEYSRPSSEWDLAFEINGFSASIRANTQKAGLTVRKVAYAIADWNQVDTTGVGPNLHNSMETWSVGAFNRGASADPFDLGWGNYNFMTHVVTGDSCYVITLANGSIKKLKIDALVGGIYNFTYANLDGSNEVSASIDKTDYTGKNFAYYSLESDQEIDREPASADWDLNFSRYIEFVGVHYPVTGVLLNAGAQVEQVNGVAIGTAQQGMGVIDTTTNAIGNDWKAINLTTFQWDIQDSLTYFVHSTSGNVFTMVFTAFGGGATGTYYFNRSGITTTSVAQLEQRDLNIFPNPAVEELTIDLGAQAQGGLLEIRDMSGRLALQERVPFGVERHTTSLHVLRSGLYMVGFTSDQVRRSATLVVK